MSTLLRHAPRWAAASILILAASAASAQSDDNSGDTSSGTPAPSASPALPGIVMQRDVYLPVDSTGHPTSNQYIVVERRVIPRKQDESGDASGSSGGDGASDVPTRFILVPQDGGNGQDDNDDSGDSGASPQ